MSKPKKLFKYKIPDLNDYLGRTVIINQKKITIKHIVGNIGMMMGRRPEHQRPQYLEINGKYRLSMLRFFAQMNGATDITEEQFKQFEQMECWSEKGKELPGKIDPKVCKVVDDILKNKGNENV